MSPYVDPFTTDGGSFINPLGLIFTLLMGVLLFALPRRYALLPVIALVCYMTMGMRIVVGSLNFTMLRIVLLFGWARLIFRGEMKAIKLNPLDKLLIAWSIVGLIAYILLWQTSDAFKYKIGAAYNDLGFYFMFRFLIRDMDEFLQALKIYAIMIVPLAGAMIVEKMTGRNSFAVFGGVPPETYVRDGTLRCQGPFAHPILAGTFGATLMPLFVGLWAQGKSRLIAAIAFSASAVITVTSASSGPLLAFILGLIALFMWPLRLQMRKVRWAFAATLIFLQIVMKAPVWFLLARVDVFNGSTGYHRALLIDRAIANLSGWWLVGTQSTWAWASKDDHLFDVTNAYLLNGADGGLITMFLFIAIVAVAFKGVGRAVRGSEGHKSTQEVWMLWALGAALFAHAVTFISVSYFDQNFVNWYLLLAVISTCTGPFLLMPRHDFLASLEIATPSLGKNGLSEKPLPPGRGFARGNQTSISVERKLGLSMTPKTRL
jgi:hypothetical protein